MRTGSFSVSLPGRRAAWASVLPRRYVAEVSNPVIRSRARRSCASYSRDRASSPRFAAWRSSMRRADSPRRTLAVGAATGWGGGAAVAAARIARDTKSVRECSFTTRSWARSPSSGTPGPLPK
jgi:hypothetical protein